MAGGVLGVAFLTLVIELCGAYVGVAGQLLDLLHPGTVFQCIGERGLPERVDADTTSAEAIDVNAGVACILLDDLPDSLPAQLFADEVPAVLGERTEEGTVDVG